MIPPEAYDVRICSDCLEDFRLTPDEVRHYSRPSKVLPVRCPECRQARWMPKAVASVYGGWMGHTSKK